jgi:alpha-L-fucosidase
MWGYNKAALHLTPDEAWAKIEHAASYDANLLLNIGPLGDGSVHPEDVRTLREIGRRLRRNGWPGA